MPGGIGGGNVNIPQGYQPQFQGQADQGFSNLVSSIYGPYTGAAYTPGSGQQFGGGVPNSAYAPQFNQILSGAFNNPYLSQALGWSQGASNAAGGVGNQAIDLSQQLSGLPMATAGLGNQNAGYAQQVAGYAPQVAQLAGQIPGMANQIWQAAADPQQAQYNQLAQQQGAQSNAANAAAGVSGTPYGASLTNQALQNLALNWQNQQLGRMTQGGQAAGNLYGQAGNLYGEAGNLLGQAGNLNTSAGNLYGLAPQIGQENLQLGGGGANLVNQAGQMPMNVWDNYLNQLMGLTGSAQQGIQQPLQQGASDWMSYLNLGQSAEQNQLRAAQLQMQQQQQQAGFAGGLFGNILSPLAFGSGGIGSLFGGQGLLGMLGGGGDWSSG
jgi:hypothetical protein